MTDYASSAWACDVLVVGAGPAGSACAAWLARHGVSVILVDQHDFPRDKTCGDGLIPDAHAALAQRHGLGGLHPQAGDGRAHHRAGGGVAPPAQARLRLDLLPRRGVQYRRGHLTELLIRRAAASPRIRQRMANLLEERATPAQLITLRGLYKLITE